MASLQGIDPKLKEYLRVHQLPDVYESLLTGLLVVCPDDPLKWIIQCMEIIKSKGIYDVAWDMFVPNGMRPDVKQMTDTYLDEIFTFTGEGTVPTTKMYAMAYNHYNYKILSMTFGSWMTYFFNKKNRKKEILRKMQEARIYYRHRIMRIHLKKWLDWKNFIVARHTGAYNIIKHIYDVSLERMIFNAWRAVAVDARKTREYFERLERGELDEDYDAESGASGGGENYRDEISLLPRKCAIQIFSNLDIMDLGRCAQVCRAWKVITGAPSIWSHLNFAKVRSRVNDKIVTTSLSKCRPYLVHLNLRGCNTLHLPILKSIAECRNLQDLNLSECKVINDDVMRTIAER